jgi:hypothetical protein
MPNKYPTKEEILAVSPAFSKEIIKAAIEMKRSWIENRDDHEMRFRAIYDFLHKASVIYGKPEILVSRRGEYFYAPDSHLIAIGDKLSIISSLHELGHHLLGSSELEACRFSVHLFKQVFPKAYAKLTWDGHMLKK